MQPEEHVAAGETSSSTLEELDVVRVKGMRPLGLEDGWVGTIVYTLSDPDIFCVEFSDADTRDKTFIVHKDYLEKVEEPNDQTKD